MMNTYIPFEEQYECPICFAPYDTVEETTKSSTEKKCLMRKGATRKGLYMGESRENNIFNQMCKTYDVDYLPNTNELHFNGGWYDAKEIDVREIEKILLLC